MENRKLLNDKIEELTKAFTVVTKNFYKAELAYKNRYYELLIQSMLGTAAKREAEANLVCKEEGLLEPVYNLRGELRALQMELTSYIEISKALRNSGVVVYNDVDEQQS